ncbi:hypothetical protein VTH8203_00491 [Vibrio thalassae]|uniref:L-ornithine N(alpha)-acyltransferase n=1 Tax=Vibrio thalassae TaxID=1243014 RepID=A0A240EFX0_9VIBR|nr:hypothetical protein VTH8203_00491 [Vibrio thalassae]
MLGRELLNKKKSVIPISIGNNIKFSEVSSLDSQQLVLYLRLNTYLLNHSHPNKNALSSSRQQIEQTIASETHLSELLEDIELLPEEHLLLTSGEFEVYCTTMDHIPAVMREIGRIREINFRRVGEGTGQPLDIDQFDQSYQHLFVWDKEKQKLVGAYRLGLVDQLIKQNDLRALYSRTLFNFEQSFLDTMGRSIEMGRSVIAEEYQKSMGALLLLWKGIAEFIRRRPNYTHLFGPVSISNDYSDMARQLLTDTMTLHHYDNESTRHVSASNPPKQNHYKQWCPQSLGDLADVQLLSRVISRLDTGKGVPVLLRQYLNLNGKLVCFNVDANFNDALDGLIVVDLTTVPQESLARYMGTDAAKHYLKHHNSLSI